MRAELFTGTDALSHTLWHELADRDQTCGFTNTPLWIRACSETRGWVPACLVWKAEEVVVPFVVRRRRKGISVLAESQPGGLLGGPVAAGGPHRSLSTLIQRDLQGVALELLLFPSCNRLDTTRWERTTHKVHRVTFRPTRRPVRELASRKCASAARHAARHGVEVVSVKDGQYLEATIDIHNRQQRGRNGPTFSAPWWYRLVQDMHHHVGLWSAVYEGQVLASLLVGWWNEKGIALISTSDPQARPLKAGNLLYLTVLEQLEALGLESLDLGGSRGNEALEFFKESVGARPSYRVFYRYRSPLLRIYQRFFSSRSQGD